MTSQLNVDTIVDKAGSGGSNVKMANTSTYVDGSATQNTVQGLAKAHCNFNGTGTISFRNSFNCSSLSDLGTGEYDVNYTNSMDSVYHSVTSGVSGSGVINFGQTEVHQLLVSKCRYRTFRYTAGLEDFSYNSVTQHGDLA